MESKKSKKILGIIVDILLIIIVIIAIVISVLTFSSKASGNGVANIMGYSPFAVQSDSMSPTFDKGDLIISKTKGFDATKLQVGDIITFYATDLKTGNDFINSHRIVKVESLNDSSDYRFYTTKGDNLDTNDLTRIGSSDVIGVYTGKRVPVLGSVMDFLRTQTGFMICVLIPLAIFFIYELYKFLSIIIAKKNEKATIEGISEEEKKRIAEEYIKSHKQAENDNAEKADAENVNK